MKTKILEILEDIVGSRDMQDSKNIQRAASEIEQMIEASYFLLSKEKWLDSIFYVTPYNVENDFFSTNKQKIIEWISSMIAEGITKGTASGAIELLKNYVPRKKIEELNDWLNSQINNIPNLIETENKEEYEKICKNIDIMMRLKCMFDEEYREMLRSEIARVDDERKYRITDRLLRECKEKLDEILNDNDFKIDKPKKDKTMKCKTCVFFKDKIRGINSYFGGCSNGKVFGLISAHFRTDEIKGVNISDSDLKKISYGIMKSLSTVFNENFGCRFHEEKLSEILNNKENDYDTTM